ncbi:hypothetical phage membrane protein [Campylobacter phage CPt10]|uniref:Uncharacterized protein n=2 Tax=Firehammervirus CPt10 TaxID=722418 RepID=A0A410T717_9CAUD|nr:membrane protein [Campylobacter phage CPt10]QAU04775.1 hypothetical protein [Campylobacter phage CP20]CBJ94241.1 hypothetical phage membrane protein [Campylobacter phage CPt10]
MGEQAEDLKKKLRYYWFVFRWFLIGRYHCSSGEHYTISLRTVWKICNRTVWGVITFSLIYAIASFFDYVG